MKNIEDQIKNFTIIPHLWKYANAKNSLDMPYFLNEEKNLGICGDYFNHNNLEECFQVLNYYWGILNSIKSELN